MTKEEAVVILGDKYCTKHNCLKVTPMEAFYFPEIEDECQQCVWEQRKQVREAKKVLGI